MITSAPETRVDAALLRIIIGFRLVSAIWITVLGIISTVSWEARAGVVAGLLTLVWVWTALSFWAAGSGTIATVPWLVMDLVVALVVVLVEPTAEATQGTFVGGYPMTSVLLWGYSYGIWGGLGSGLLIAVAVALGELSIAARIGNGILYVAVGGVAAWAFQTLRQNEQRRLRAEVELEAERAARIRSDERADVAAHLHDSVLQTLALIQKGSTDAAEVRNLARVQERELRAWLLDASVGEPTLAGSLEAACSEVERKMGVGVELVAVGDRPLDEHLRALVAAAAEAVMNAAKHAGVEQVSVYLEAGTDPIQVFIRDRGLGFDPDSVPVDRRGLAESVIGRMERHGGRAEVISSPGTGTEVRLSIPAPLQDVG